MNKIIMALICIIVAIQPIRADWVDDPIPRKEAKSPVAILCFVGSAVTAGAAVVLYRNASTNEYNSRVISRFDTQGIANYKRKAEYQRNMGNLAGMFSASMLLGGVLVLVVQGQTMRLEKKF